MHASSSPAPFTGPANPRMILWIVAIGMFMQLLDATIVNTALPAMAESLGESALRLHAVVVSYALTMAVIIPATGWLADRFGTRRLLLLAMGLFTVGSVACAASASLNQLIAARILQGMGGAMLMPVGRLVVLRAFPGELFLGAISFVAIPALIGPLIGPTLGGWLVEAASWHWIFLINVPIGAAGLLAIRRWIPNFTASSGRFDLAGYLLLIFAMISVSVGLDGLSNPERSGVLLSVLVLGGFAAVGVYWHHARRTRSPIFPPLLFVVRSYRIGLMGNLFARLGSSSMPYLLPLLLQLALGYSPAAAGMLMLPVALASIGAKRVITPIIMRYGYRRVLIVNTLLLGLLIADFALMAHAQPLWLLIIQLTIFGAINSCQFTAMNAVTLKELAPAHAGSGNSLFSMIQMLGMSLGVTCAAAFLSAFSFWLGDSGVETLQAFRATFATIGLLTMGSAAVFWQLRERKAVHAPDADALADA